MIVKLLHVFNSSLPNEYFLYIYDLWCSKPFIANRWLILKLRLLISKIKTHVGMKKWLLCLRVVYIYKWEAEFSFPALIILAWLSTHLSHLHWGWWKADPQSPRAASLGRWHPPCAVRDPAFKAIRKKATGEETWQYVRLASACTYMCSNIYACNTYKATSFMKML